MKGAMASVEVFAFAASAGPEGAARPRRLSLVIGMPERAASGDRWQCRVALADLHRPEVLEGRDSVEALVLAVARARVWLAALEADGFRLARDRAGVDPFALP
jgi:hypothetical protein